MSEVKLDDEVEQLDSAAFVVTASALCIEFTICSTLCDRNVFNAESKSSTCGSYIFMYKFCFIPIKFSNKLYK